MPEQFKLSVYIGGSHGDLPERLLAMCEVVTATSIGIWWESGIDGVPLTQQGVRVDATTDQIRVVPTLDLIEVWFRESGLPTILVEMAPTFLRSLERDS